MTRARGEEPKQQIQPGSRCLLVVEGNDECVLAKRVGLPQGTTVLDLGGMDDGTKLEQYATVVGLDPSFFALTSVGVVVDAEGDAAFALKHAQAFLARLGYPVPTGPGEIAKEASRTGGIFILPDGKSPGALETLQRQAVGAERAACVDALFACTGRPPAWNHAQRDKAWIRAYAATVDARARGDQLYGPAPKLDTRHAAFTAFREWLGRL